MCGAGIPSVKTPGCSQYAGGVADYPGVADYHRHSSVSPGPYKHAFDVLPRRWVGFGPRFAHRFSMDFACPCTVVVR